ncbi:MAG TPA: T9SS type A sorting domain-containing protein, partial [Chitinophagales bacterium]|nr:T9SS type A sorting domain-containing protein [Chitinophagales bacterium]
DCNGATQVYFGYYSPGNMTAEFTIDFCPTVNPGPFPITVNGTFDNFAGPVPVIFFSDYQPGGAGDTVWTSSFSTTVMVNTYGSPINATFIDCNGVEQIVYVAPVLGTTTATFDADFCPDTTSSNPCATPLFTASYDAVTNTFNLMLDSSLNAALGQFTWDFGDGTTSNDAYPSHVFANNDLYNVCLSYGTPVGTVCTYCHVIGIDSSGAVFLRTDAGFTVNVVPFAAGTAVENLNAAAFDIYPNPVSDNVTVTLFAERAAQHDIEIFNAAGQKVKTFSANVTAGRNEIRLPLGELAKGLYLMNVRFDEKTISRSFVK